jgi:hypothetical protein
MRLFSSVLQYLFKQRVKNMKLSSIFVLLILSFLLIDFTDGQGSPAASIGAYITLFKEKKRLKAERAKLRNKTKVPKVQKTTPRNVNFQNDCSFQNQRPCQFYYFS